MYVIYRIQPSGTLPLRQPCPLRKPAQELRECVVRRTQSAGLDKSSGRRQDARSLDEDSDLVDGGFAPIVGRARGVIRICQYKYRHTLRSAALADSRPRGSDECQENSPVHHIAPTRRVPALL
jgi:hypothetical protein